MDKLQTYDRVQRVFHWTMAVIVLVAIALGFWASFLTPGIPLRKALLEVHKSLGFTVAVLIVPRIIYRVFAAIPPLIDDTGPLARIAAVAAHVTLYGLMLFMPITGYMFSAAGGYSLPWFGLFHWPRLFGLDPATAQLGQWLHDHGAWLVYAVVSLHLAAVGWHHFYKKDGVLSRMLGPDRRRQLTAAE
jgi:cytochrome b561